VQWPLTGTHPLTGKQGHQIGQRFALFKIIFFFFILGNYLHKLSDHRAGKLCTVLAMLARYLVVDALCHRIERCFLLSADARASETSNFVLLPLFKHFIPTKPSWKRKKMPRIILCACGLGI
jgi:hypothetical protein